MHLLDSPVGVSSIAAGWCLCADVGTMFCMPCLMLHLLTITTPSADPALAGQGHKAAKGTAATVSAINKGQSIHTIHLAACRTTPQQNLCYTCLAEEACACPQTPRNRGLTPKSSSSRGSGFAGCHAGGSGRQPASSGAAAADSAAAEGGAAAAAG